MSGSEDQAPSQDTPKNQASKPEHPGPAATEYEREVYKRALKEWEEGNEFMKRYAAAQKNGKLLSVNDPVYKNLVADFRMRQKMGAGAGAKNDAGEEESKAKSKRKSFDLKRRLLRLVKT
ncbi:hypothetical protein ONS95_013214 [Cadophora gregata]|uniref:uncharacterized protein n=1 Tax=Cadophora gregata TaxID=51156 RepID=UPI0026DAD366|nr:uncharacterized protein ONS95_013214 [Cadophora gregata]KAK0116184.1 hypothetical protein ONS95_013214 [Cadophora gregata]